MQGNYAPDGPRRIAAKAKHWAFIPRLVRGFFFCWGAALYASSGCSSIEGEVLTLRPAWDMAEADLGLGNAGYDGGPDLRPPWPHCVVREQGDGKSCQTSEVWTLVAERDCKKLLGLSGLHVEGLQLFGACGLAMPSGSGLYRGVRYFCCRLSV